MAGTDTRLVATFRERSGSGPTPFSPDVRDAEARPRVAPTGPDHSGGGTSLVVPIQTGGSSPPFFFTGLGAAVLTHNLAQRLGKSQPLYALLTHSVDERHMDHEAFVDVASRYVLEVKRVQGTGPYLLGGFCGQGTMVYEMAQQLVGSGERVAMLAIFDAAAPGERSAWSRLRETVYWAARKVQFHAVELSRQDPHDRAAYFRTRMRHLYGRFRPTPHGPGPAAVRSDSAADDPQPELPPTQRALRYQLATKYIPRTYPGRIVLFVGDDSRFAYDATLGWSTLAEGGVDVRRVSGIHTQMLMPPHDRSLASALAGAIRSALDMSPRTW